MHDLSILTNDQSSACASRICLMYKNDNYESSLTNYELKVYLFIYFLL